MVLKISESQNSNSPIFLWQIGLHVKKDILLFFNLSLYVIYNFGLFVTRGTCAPVQKRKKRIYCGHVSFLVTQDTWHILMKTLLEFFKALSLFANGIAAYRLEVCQLLELLSVDFVCFLKTKKQHKNKIKK